MTLKRQLPLCAYCGKKISKGPKRAFIVEFPELPGIPRVAWHFEIEKDRRCLDFDDWATQVKIECGDVAALVHIMKRGPGRIRATVEWGQHLDGLGYTDRDEWKDMDPRELFANKGPKQADLKMEI